MRTSTSRLEGPPLGSEESAVILITVSDVVSLGVKTRLYQNGGRHGLRVG